MAHMLLADFFDVLRSRRRCTRSWPRGEIRGVYPDSLNKYHVDGRFVESLWDVDCFFGIFLVQVVPSLKLTFSPLKMDGWKMILFLLGLLEPVSGSVINFPVAK